MRANKQDASPREGLLSAVRASRFNLWLVLGLSLLIAAGVGVYFGFYEGVLPNQIFTALVTLALVAIIATASRRLLFSTTLVALLIAAVTAISFYKRAQELMVLHAWDFWFYVPSVFASAVKPEHLRFTLAFTGGLLIAGLLAWLAWKIERPILRRAWTAIICALLTGGVVVATLERPERRHTQFFWDDSFITSFYASWAEAAIAWRRGNLVEAAASASRPPLRADSVCAPEQKPPNIILIHQESVFEPSIFPQVEYDRRLDAFFRPPGGQHRSMRVETYGGGSWMTEFSIMTGLSAQSFGGMRGFLQTFMVNRLGDTLPQALQRCGYRNVLFYPMLKVFISTAPFYNSIGVPEIFDAKDQKAPTAWERDRFYFGNALAEMERHFATSKAPLFTFIQTMGTHWPYDVKHFAEEDVPSGGPGYEVNEFLRRLWLAKVDYDDMKRQLESRFPGERFLIVHYGDHHPMATRFLLGFKENTEAEDIVLPPDSPGLVTYLALDGVRYTPLPVPATEPVDAAYLGTLAMTAAGLPLPDSMKERLRLLDVCKGRYYDCPDRNEILGFHRRLLDAGLLKPK
jgi:hypothetical protein